MEKTHQCAEGLTMLPLVRYRFTFVMHDAVRLPELAGSALRGVFGHALRQLACMTKAKTCTGCPLIEQCPYPTIFEPHEKPSMRSKQQTSDNKFATTLQHIPPPYVIEPPLCGAQTIAAGATISFNMQLIGAALPQLPLIIFAWQRAFARGINKTRSTGDLLTVEAFAADETASTIYSKETTQVQTHATHLIIPAYTAPQDIHLHLLTPLRIEKNKVPLGPKEITAAALLRQLIRRVSLVMQFQYAENTAWHMDKNTAQKLNALADTVKDERRLRWQEWSRYSSRQQQVMELGGVTGHWLLKQVPVELLPYLYLGQWLHAGKEAVFGLGKYEITATAWNPEEARV
jgi:hypothetical protein